MPPKGDSKRRVDDNLSGESGNEEDDSIDRLIKMRQQHQNANRMMLDEDDDENLREAVDGCEGDEDIVLEEEGDEHEDRMETESNHLANSAMDFDMGDHPHDEDEDYYRDDEDEDEYRRHHEHEEEDDEEEDEDGEDLMDQSVRRRLGAESGHFFDALSGMITGFSGRVRPILAAIRQREDPSEVMMGLQELADNLLISTEDLLIGYFPIDQFAEALVDIMREPMFEDAPEIMLLACRNISNLIEVIPSSVGNVVHAGAVPLLCQKLLEIQYIDLAEQALSTIEKISQDYPQPLVKEGGLGACLTYLDFFSTHVQRTALSAAANCCKNVPKSSFAMIRDVMPTLENVLSNSDQQVAEKACICVCQIVDSFALHNAELEQLITPELLQKFLSLVNPNVSHDTTSNIRTRVLKVIGTLAKSSHSLAGILVKEGTADLIYQILTHYSPMFDSNDCITKDNTAIIQALIHTTKDLLVTSLNIIAEVFPSVAADSESTYVSPYRIMVLDDEKRSTLAVRKDELLKYPKELEHFARVSASLLLDVYSASIDLAVRQKVLVALFKLCSCLDPDVLEKAIKNVDVCALLGGIFSQGDQPSLVVGALEIGKILLTKLPSISRSQYYRLGIISQVTEISEREVAPQQTQLGEIASGSLQEDSDEEHDADSEEDDEEEEEDSEESDREEEPSRPQQQEAEGSNNRMIVLSFYSNLSQLVVHEAKRWLDLYKSQAQNAGGYEQEAERAMDNLKEISQGLERRDSNLGDYLNNLSQVISSVSSFELVHSGVLKSIWSILVEGTDEQTEQCRRGFLQVFIGHTSSESPPLGTLIDKLHEALGRSEKFDVITSGLWDSRATPASMLARQLRIRLVAEDEEEFPQQFRSVVLSIQAIATFKAVDEFYKSKLALNELLTGGSGGGSLSSALRRHQGRGGRLPGALAALAAATGLGRELGGDEEEEEEDEQQHGEEQENSSNNDITVHRDGDDDEPMVEELGEEVRGEENDEGSSNNNGRREEDDWHLEFYLNDQVIPHDSTIYGAIYKHLEYMDKDKSQSGQSTMSAQNFARSIWHNTYTIKFKKASGPPTDLDKNSEVQEAEDLNPFTQTPASFGSDKTTAEVIRLFSVLFTLNSDVEDFLGPSVHQKSLSNSKFLSSKLTAKLNRQLEEPLVVASGTLPSWIVDATRLYPFLFPFETRYMFLQSTSFGYSRSMARWQTGNRGINNSDGTEVREDHRLPMGRLVRQKVRISRKHLLHSAIKVMDLCGASPNVLEVEYFDEVGTGLGPTLEFYSSVSREFCLKKLKLWRDDGHQQSSDNNYVFNSQGLFPSPMNEEKAQTSHGQKMIQLFKTLGIFVARAMLDSRIIDLNLNPVFFRIAGSKVTVAPSIGTVAAVDKQLANSLLSLQQFVHKKHESPSTPITVDGVTIEDLSLDFTCPGYPDIELVPGGSKMHVTLDNVEEYLRLVVDMTLGSGVKRQIEAFRQGFSQVFPYSALHAFTPEELASLCGQGEEDWSYETLYDVVKADHGYNKDSRPVQDLLHIMNEFDGQQRRAFLQFMTGSPNLPIGGFQALHPVFTVVCKHNDDGASPDSYLPSVMTCANYLKLPNYSSKEILAEKLKTAMYEGRGAFLLS